jgi:hypothetical protein
MDEAKEEIDDNEFPPQFSSSEADPLVTTSVLSTIVSDTVPLRVSTYGLSFAGELHQQA